MKKVLSMLLALSLIVTLMPTPTAQAADAGTDAVSMARQQVEAYAASISQSGSATTAMTNMVFHSVFKGGRDLYTFC